MINLYTYTSSLLMSYILIYDVRDLANKTLIHALLYVFRQHKTLLSHSKRTRMGRDSWPLTWNCRQRENRTGWWGRPNSLWQLWSHLPHQLLFSQSLHIKAASSQPFVCTQPLSISSFHADLDGLYCIRIKSPSRLHLGLCAIKKWKCVFESKRKNLLTVLNLRG